VLVKVDHEKLLKRVDSLGRELEHLKRDLLQSLKTGMHERQARSSLFGSVRGGDAAEEMIEEAKRSLFPSVQDTQWDG
jgi:hypothetical protein